MPALLCVLRLLPLLRLRLPLRLRGLRESARVRVGRARPRERGWLLLCSVQVLKFERVERFKILHRALS